MKLLSKRYYIIALVISALLLILLMIYLQKNTTVEKYENDSDMEKVFTDVYEKDVWGGGNISSDYLGNSGEGSEVNVNKDTYYPFLKKFIIDNNVKTVADLGCGDFRGGRLIYDDIDIKYTGYDTYAKLVESHSKTFEKPKYNFVHLNLYENKEEIKSADLCIIKDVVQHWKLEKIYKFLDYLVESKKFKYILIINCSHQDNDDTDIPDGGFRPLSIEFLPLKKYNPKKLYNYSTKEVSVIEC